MKVLTHETVEEAPAKPTTSVTVKGAPAKPADIQQYTDPEDPLSHLFPRQDYHTGTHIITGNGFGPDLRGGSSAGSRWKQGNASPYGTMYTPDGKFRSYEYWNRPGSEHNLPTMQQNQMLTHRLGAGVRNWGMRAAENTLGRGPWVGGLASALATGGTTALLLALYNRLYGRRHPVVPWSLGAAGIGLGAGAAAGHMWQKTQERQKQSSVPIWLRPRTAKSAASRGPSPEEALMAAPIPWSEKQILLAGLLKLSPAEAAALQRILSGVGGAGIAYVISRFLGARGLLGLGITLAGGLLGSKLMR